MFEKQLLRQVLGRLDMNVRMLSTVTWKLLNSLQINWPKKKKHQSVLIGCNVRMNWPIGKWLFSSPAYFVREMINDPLWILYFLVFLIRHNSRELIWIIYFKQKKIAPWIFGTKTDKINVLSHQNNNENTWIDNYISSDSHLSLKC